MPSSKNPLEYEMKTMAELFGCGMTSKRQRALGWLTKRSRLSQSVVSLFLLNGYLTYLNFRFLTGCLESMHLRTSLIASFHCPPVAT